MSRSARHPTRRAVLAGLAGTALAAPALAQRAAPRVLVIGGGFGGATAARALAANGLAVTLLDTDPVYTACPLSNAVIAGLRDMEAQRFNRMAQPQTGVAVRQEAATAIDPTARTVRTSGGGTIVYDRLVLAPGIDLRFTGLPGYDAEVAERLPHAWKAGPQTLLLRDQLSAMEDGGVVLMAVPANPYRCPPGPYERASLIAHFIKTKRPKSKLIILDAKDVFSKQKLFQQAWETLYPGIVEWVGLSAGGKVTEVEAGSRTLVTEFGRHTGAVVNIIPAQWAGAIARNYGTADRTGWCPVDPVTFESKLVPGIHVIGDAAIMGAMPKSAFAANAQAKVCADAVTALLTGHEPLNPKLVNTCYSLVGPGYGISVAGVYRPGANGLLADVEGAGGTSPLDAPASQRQAEAAYAEAWFRTITAEAFG